MDDDERCCGTGTCLINAEGQCWCGQRWDGEKMCFAEKKADVQAVQLPTQSPEPASEK